MATAIWTGLQAGIVRYDLSYDATRPDRYANTVNITFYLRYYLRSSSTTFGYNLVVSSLWCGGKTVTTNYTIKNASPNKFDSTVSFSTSVSTANSYVSGVRLIMTSPQNVAAGGSSGVYDTYPDVNINVPSKYYYPTAPTSCSINVTSIKPDGTVTLTWSGEAGGSEAGIDHFQIELSSTRGGSAVYGYVRVTGSLYYTNTGGPSPNKYSLVVNTLKNYDTGAALDIRPRRYINLFRCYLYRFRI